MSGVADSAHPHRILDTGISVVHDPQDPQPIVDICLVHGLHGHPYKSWTAKAPATGLLSPTTSFVPSNDAQGQPKGSWRRAIRRLGSKRAEGTLSRSKPDSRSTTLTSFGDNAAAHEHVFWPADLLPARCPRARVLTFGYDSKITKYMSGATNKGSLVAHSKDLLFSICRNRVSNRPIIFVAHSLGGIVVKEMLERSATAAEPELRNIVESTAAVIFLGTPHRGSPDLAAMGEYVRSIISGLRMETTSAILDSLGLKTTDLERAQEAFSRLWQKYDFRVKTFQEGLGMSGVNLGALTNKVVPDYSSSIGDHREHCETLQANHKEMCRFTGYDDAKWRKVSGELCSIYLSILELHQQDNRLDRQMHHDWSSNEFSSRSVPKPGKDKILSDYEKASLKSLWFPSMYTRLRRVEKPAQQTCSWLFEHEMYQDWFSGTSRDAAHGLLWLKGKPGAGKSTLMKEAYNRTMLGQADGDYYTAAFFFSAKDSDLEHSPSGIWRSLLHQLLPSRPDSLKDFGERWAARRDYAQEGEQPWEEAELKTVVQQALVDENSKKTFIFIDALDECDSARIRDQAYFWREVTSSAHANHANLNVCISSRHFPLISISHCPEIVVEHHNNLDIAKYVGQRFRLGVGVAVPQWEFLKDNILARAMGVFLWAVLVVDDLLLMWDDGRDIQYLMKQLDVVPDALESLFSQMLSSVSEEDRLLTARLFQWVTLAAKPLRVHEWHHVLAFIRSPTPVSLAEWRASDHFTQTDSQLERQIRSISKGLVEIRSTPVDQKPEQALESESICAGAGSLNLEIGETRTVSVIHESVRDFFLHGAGFETLVPSLGLHPIGNGHLSIMETCLDYLDIKELDALVEARHGLKSHRSIGWPSRPSTRSLYKACSDAPSTGLETPHLKVKDNSTNRTFEANKGLTADRPAASSEPEVPGLLRLSFNLLSDSSFYQGVDVAHWVGSNEYASSVKSLTSLSGLSNHPVSRSPASCRSQMLEDYPALLSYATYEFFTHAGLAQRDGVIADPIVSRLRFWAGWYRLSALREDIPEGMRLIDCATQVLGLDSWSLACSVDPDPDYSYLEKLGLRRDGQTLAAFELQETVGFSIEEALTQEQRRNFDISDITKDYEAAVSRGAKGGAGIVEPTQRRGQRPRSIASVSSASSYAASGLEVEAPRKRVRRQGSIASFSSASSHTGSINWIYSDNSNGTSAEGRNNLLGDTRVPLRVPIKRFTLRSNHSVDEDFDGQPAIGNNDDDDLWGWDGREGPLQDSDVDEQRTSNQVPLDPRGTASCVSPASTPMTRTMMELFSS
ncbi:hypothetical protein CC79DRAFT_1293059 [Sarocladium strictum]